MAVLKDLHVLIRKLMFNIDRGDTAAVTAMIKKIDSIKDELSVNAAQLLPHIATHGEDLGMIIHYLDNRSYAKALDHLDEYDYRD